MSAPRRSLCAIEVDLGEELLVVDVDARRIHTLNETAAATWRALDGHRSITDVSEALADAYGAPIDLVTADVEAVVDDLRAVGLIDGDAIGGPAADPVESSRWDSHRRALLDQRTPIELGHYRALGWPFVLRGSSAEALGPLERLLEPLRTEVVPATSSPVHLLERNGAYELWVDGRPTGESKRPSLLHGRLLGMMNRLAVAHLTGAVALHAGAVQTHAGAVVFPAPADHGKSTLATFLVRSGMAYLTDEALAIDLDTLQAQPYPKPISLDPGSYPLFPELAPDDASDAGAGWHVDHRLVGPGRTGSDAPIVAVVSPRRVDGGGFELTKLSANHGFQRLLENAFDFRGAGPSAVRALASIARDVPAFEMRHGGVDLHGAAIAETIGGFEAP